MLSSKSGYTYKYPILCERFLVKVRIYKTKQKKKYYNNQKKDYLCD